jgi:hypothetical protein
MLVRLRAGRCFYADPTAQPRTGRPRRHGHKFACDTPPDVAASCWRSHAGGRAVRTRARAGVERAAPGRRRVSTPCAMREVGARLCAGPGCWSRSAACRSRRARRKPSGCGGMGRRARNCQTWTAPGAPTSVASIWNIPADSSSRPATGPSRACVTPTKPTAGRGWLCWPLLRCVWRARLPRTSRCHGSRPSRPADSLLRAPSGRFRSSCHGYPSWLARHNPADGPPGGPKGKRSGRAARYPALTRALLSATQVA